MKILAIGGSPRLNGNTDYLVDLALEEARKLGAEAEKIVLSQHQVSSCQGHDNCSSLEGCAQKDDMAWILDSLCQADGVILATPVYYYNVSAQMKAFIDRNYFLYEHGRKAKAGAVGLIIVAGSLGIEDTLHTLKQFVNETFNVRDDRLFLVSGYANKQGEVKHNRSLEEEARGLGRRMVAVLQ